MYLEAINNGMSTLYTDGMLKVMDGFGDITIDNQTSWDIDIQNLKTGEDKELLLSGNAWRVSGRDWLVTADDTISFNSADNTITREYGSWLKDGFYVGQEIRIETDLPGGKSTCVGSTS